MVNRTPWNGSFGNSQKIVKPRKSRGRDQVFWVMFITQAAKDREAGRMMTTPLSENLRQAEEKLRETLFELSPIATYLLDTAGNFLSANRAGEQLLKAPAREIVGANIVSTYPPEELSSGTIPAETLADGLLRFERRLLRRDGSTIPVEISLSPMLPEGRQAVIQDIS